VAVVLPPIQADLLGLVDRADDEADAEGEKLDVGEGDLDVPCHDQALVEDQLEDVHEARAARMQASRRTVMRHR
jgi:hypothetical protein